MINTKERILTASKELFNKYGVANTNLRKISAHIGISQGNLNYHFNKREDILESLYFEMVLEFDKRIKNSVNKSLTLKTIYDESKISMRRMFEFRFIWLDIHHIIRENKSIKAHFLTAQTHRLKGLEVAFDILKSQNIIREEQFKNEFVHLFHRLISYGNFWISSTEMYEPSIKKINIEEKHSIYFEMFFPYLTYVGKAEFFQLISINEG